MLDFWLRASCMVIMFANRSDGSPSAEQNTLMCFSYSTSIRVTNLHQPKSTAQALHPSVVQDSGGEYILHNTMVRVCGYQHCLQTTGMLHCQKVDCCEWRGQARSSVLSARSIIAAQNIPGLVAEGLDCIAVPKYNTDLSLD